MTAILDYILSIGDGATFTSSNVLANVPASEASTGTVYVRIRQLAADKWVEVVDRTPTGADVYRLTPTGRERAAAGLPTQQPKRQKPTRPRPPDPVRKVWTLTDLAAAVERGEEPRAVLDAVRRALHPRP